VNTRLLLLGLLFLARPIFSSEINIDSVGLNTDVNNATSIYVCSDLELIQFDSFLDDNKKDFEKKAMINYSKDDTCANITYVKLSEYVSGLKVQESDKKDRCGVAVDFCKNDKSEETRIVLQVIMVPQCGKGTKFTMTRQECKDYFLK
jgi:hypothetical protein